MTPHDCFRTYRHNAILTASSSQLVLMMYDGALRALESALAGFARPEADFRRFEVINGGLLKAHAILGELRGNLDFDRGGEIAKALADLYEFHQARLEQANRLKDRQRVVEVRRLLQDLRDGWAEMLVKAQPSGEAGVRRTA